MGELRDNLTFNLNELLEKNKNTISKKQLSELLGVSQAAVTNWTKGSNSPDIELIAKICNIFKVSINQLIGMPNDDILNLSNHEKQVILAYRARPDMQKAVDTLLNISTLVEVKSVARSSDYHEMYNEKISLDDIEKLKSQKQPSSDDDL